MGKITSLTRQKRNPNRINVYIDGSFAFGLAEITAAYLRVGQTLSAAEAENLQGADQIEKAKEVAIRYIEYRPRSIAETQQHLQKKEYPDDVIAQVLERLEAVKLLDDEAFARYWVDQRETFKPRSKIALQQELRQKGIDRAVIDEATATMDEFAAARQAAEPKAHRWMSLPEQQFRQKLGSFLQRRGFGYDVVREVTEELWAEAQAENE
ncbi:MAG: RecX family transcriptional regulator [Anaerolineales bacterium]|nr:RecX family transcriptional regulator [Anaerolineales bacterium]MCB8936777.1 RecX family transcriptional regulator [Ardenticatenaceae bacterium]